EVLAHDLDLRLDEFWHRRLRREAEEDEAAAPALVPAVLADVALQHVGERRQRAGGLLLALRALHADGSTQHEDCEQRDCIGCVHGVSLRLASARNHPPRWNCSQTSGETSTSSVTTSPSTRNVLRPTM